MEVSDAYKPPKDEPLPPPKESKPTSIAGRVAAWIFGVLVIGILIGMVLPAVTRPGVRGAALRTHCANNMRQITLAMLNYESEHGHFPPAYIADEDGKPMHSWRVLILPYLERNNLFERYSMDEPWDGPNNRKLADEIDGVYGCPSHDTGNGETNCTSYCVVTGAGTMFDADRTVKFGDINDGSSNTAILVEVNHGDIHWMEPKDLTVDEAVGVFEQALEENQVSNHPGIQNVTYADGSAHTLSTSTERSELVELFLIADESHKDESEN